MKNSRNLLFFDIETGGLLSTQSSILSLSSQRNEEQVRSSIASPVPGTRMYKWPEQNVWQHIKHLPRTSEQSLLSGWASTLESNRGSQLIGWNIGFRAQEQDIFKSAGQPFDIGFTLSRARQYSDLSSRLEKAYSRVRIRDIGREWAVSLSEQVAEQRQYLASHGADPAILEQAFQYSQKVQGIRESIGPRATRGQIAEELARRNISFAGWKMETVHGMLRKEGFGFAPFQAHRSSEDVHALSEIAGVSTAYKFSPQTLEHWSRETLRNSIISQAIRARTKTPPLSAIQEGKRYFIPQRPEDYWANLQKRATTGGLSWSEIESEILGRAGKQSERVRRGLGILEEYSIVREGGKRISGGRFATSLAALDPVISFGKKHPFLVAGSAIGFGLLAAKPFSWFSGRDDSYNTIEGLPHDGMAARRRRKTTDFGSGYQGDQEYQRKVQQRFQYFTESLEKYGQEVGTGHKRILIPKKALGEKELESLGFVPVTIAIPEAGQAGFTSWRHPKNLYHIHNFKDYWTMHEDRHAAATMLLKRWAMETGGKGGSVLTLLASFAEGLPHVVTEGVPGAFYYLQGKLTGGESMLERLKKELPIEYQRRVQHFQRIRQRTSAGIRGFFSSVKERVSRFFSGRDDDYNTIEGLRHRSMAEQKRRELTDFGSGWIRKAISKGISLSTVAKGVERLGGGATESLLRTDIMAAVKSIRAAQGITVEGQRWIYGAKLGSGIAGEASLAYRAGGIAQAGVVKISKGEGGDLLDIFAAQLKRDPMAIPKRAMMTPALAGKLADPLKFQQTQEFITSYYRTIATEMNQEGINALQYEAKMMKSAKQQAKRDNLGRFVPEVFASNKNAIVQELAGSPLSAKLPKARMIHGEKFLSPPPLRTSGEKSILRTEGLAKFMEEGPLKAIEAQRGIAHLDPHPGNIMRRGASYAMIDYGLAMRATLDNQEIRQKVLGSAYQESIELVRKQIPHRQPMTPIREMGSGTGADRPKARQKAAERKQKMEEAQKLAMKQLSVYTKTASIGHSWQTNRNPYK